MAEKSEDKKKVKQPTAKKRYLQSEKRRLRNKAFRSQVSTVLKKFEKSVATAEAKGNLTEVYSIVDKGVKKGILKLNKAGRIKSRLTKKLASSK